MSRIIAPGPQWDPETFRDARFRAPTAPRQSRGRPECRHDREPDSVGRDGQPAREFASSFVHADGVHVWTTPGGRRCDVCRGDE